MQPLLNLRRNRPPIGRSINQSQLVIQYALPVVETITGHQSNPVKASFSQPEEVFYRSHIANRFVAFVITILKLFFFTMLHISSIPISKLKMRAKYSHNTCLFWFGSQLNGSIHINVKRLISRLCIF